MVRLSLTLASNVDCLVPDFSQIPEDWRTALLSLMDAADRHRFGELQEFVRRERLDQTVFPPEEDVFAALQLTPLASVRVVILGQDPYHGAGQAHGLSFSVRPGIPHPPSLRNIFRELQDDLGIPVPRDGCLQRWAQQGVLLLNTVLTVRAAEANSHRKHGWEELTAQLIQCVNQLPQVAFVLWGAPAQKVAERIDARHWILKSPHPSPLSAHRGFFGSRPFSQVNQYLAKMGESGIDWNPTSDG
ncbi:MAG: uracil-DNA glycosylase [Planctomycetaceae bacterium]|nr:uracil-DNA glycosylase [Planctomycetaceae bacterium]